MIDPHFEQAELKPLNVVMIFLIIGTLFGVCFFTSPEPDHTPDGAVPWAAGSLLKAVTDALAFNFKIGTPNGAEIKNLVFGLASGMAVIVVAIAIFSSARSREKDFSLLEADSAAPKSSALNRQIDPLLAAQLMLGAVVALSFASALWSPLPDLAVGGSIILLGFCLWSIGLRYGLNIRACRAVAGGMVVILAAASALAVWYYYERNRSMRVGYPIGNPLFFAACMIPAAFVCVSNVACMIERLIRGDGRSWVWAAVSVIALAPIAWGLWLADSRSTYLGSAAGLVAFCFFAVRGRMRKISILASALALSAVPYFIWFAPMLAHRSETVRTRLYAWSYAQDLIAQAPILGHGQGGFALLGDSQAVQDVADDPRTLHTRLAHVHNEWLEVLVDLGSVGLVIMLACFSLTLLAGVRTLRRLARPGDRWLLTGLMASLVAMMAEESTDVALRIAGLPTVFYTVLGLIWAMIASSEVLGAARPAQAEALDSSNVQPTAKKSLAGVAGLAAVIMIGAGVSVASILDFQAARALVQFREKIEQRQWDSAVENVDLARRFRLSPNRRISARYSQAWCHLRIAEESLRDLLARSSGLTANTQLTEAGAIAIQTRAQTAVIEAGMAVALANDLSRVTSHSFGFHRLTAAGHEVMRRLALLFADQTQANEQLRLEIAALDRELERAPFDADLAWLRAGLSPDMNVAELVKLICPPMRYHQVDERYFQLVQNMSRRATFETEFQALVAQAMSSFFAHPRDRSPTYSAQIMRIASWVAAGRLDFEEAKTFAKNALDLTEQEKDKFPIGHVVVFRELAHFSFLADPNEPHVAIEISLRGRSLLPNSHEAAPVRTRMDQRLAMYYIAAGDEDTARATIPGSSLLRTAALDAELTGLYYQLCQTIMTMPPSDRPVYFMPRLRRFGELCKGPRPQASQLPPGIRSVPAMMQAQVALEQEHFDKCVKYWKEALALGADSSQVLSLAERMLNEHPENEPLTGFVQELNAYLAGPR